MSDCCAPSTNLLWFAQTEFAKRSFRPSFVPSYYKLKSNIPHGTSCLHFTDTISPLIEVKKLSVLLWWFLGDAKNSRFSHTKYVYVICIKIFVNYYHIIFTGNKCTIKFYIIEVRSVFLDSRLMLI